MIVWRDCSKIEQTDLVEFELNGKNVVIRKK